MLDVTVSRDAVPTDKKKLHMDEDGYYFVPIGAFNCFNTSGQFYVPEGMLKGLNDPKSSFNESLRSGRLYSECGHPLPEDYSYRDKNGEMVLDKKAYFERLMDIRDDNRVAHIKNVSYKETDIPCGIPGRGNVFIVSGWVKPDGSDGGRRLKSNLDAPDVNTAFSLRSIIKTTKAGDIEYRNVVLLITYDEVTRPGIIFATKFKALGLEKHKPYLFTTDDATVSSDLSFGLESGDVVDYLVGLENAECGPRLRELFDNLAEIEHTRVDRKKGALKW